MPPRPVLTPPQYALLQTLQAAPGKVARLVARLPVEAQAWAPAPGAWSVPQIITHLAAADALFLQRLERMVKERNPTVPYFGPTEAAPDEAARPADALVRFVTSRQTLLDYLNALSPADWERSGVHTTSGPTTIALQIQVIASHDHEHMGQLTALRAAWDKRPPA